MAFPKKLICLLALLLLLTSCKNGPFGESRSSSGASTSSFYAKGEEMAIRQEAAMPTMDMAMDSEEGAAMNRMAPYPGDGDDYAPNTNDRKIVKNAQLTLEVSDTEGAKDTVEEAVKKHKGSITNSNSWQVRSGLLGYHLTLRVPSEKLESLVAELESLGSKLSESFSSQDITAQYQDNESRLENLRAREERLRAMMERETENLSDVLEIDRELSSVRQQIEWLENTQNRNDVNVSYSTLQLTLQPEVQIEEIQTPEWNVKKSWTESVNLLQRTAQGVFDFILGLVALAPIWLPVVLIVWGIWHWTHRK